MLAQSGAFPFVGQVRYLALLEADAPDVSVSLDVANCDAANEERPELAYASVGGELCASGDPNLSPFAENSDIRKIAVGIAIR